ncbi:MAG: HAMP domain-containing sensor histidine kinase, partial [Dehalococcoidia bacterium]|nr:HAMP domain-containing sensor histidine kinase [Dehalococcoidia bacterium]
MADRVARIVRCLLTSTRPSEDGKASTDVNDALETMLLLLDSKLSASRVHVVRNYHDNLPLVPGDSIEIQELFGNLISNACDAMPEGGYLRLTTTVENQSVVAEVSDTGTGITEADMAKVFDPFFTTKETSGGIGLGLYVVKNIAQKHGGKVEVRSQSGQGTTFRVAFPATDVYDQAHGKQTERASSRDKVAV